jgi:hypothetical protein
VEYGYKIQIMECKEFVQGGLPNESFYRKKNETHELGTGTFFVHKTIISVVKRVEFVGDRMSCLTLRGRWYHFTVLNVHTPT